MSENPNSITPPTHSFAGLPVCTRLEDLEADIAIIGLHYVSPYPQRLPTAPFQTAVETAPDAIRLQSSVFIDNWDHYDFDIDDVLLADRPVRLEVRPERDINGLTAATGAQLIINFIGTMARNGQIGG